MNDLLPLLSGAMPSTEPSARPTFSTPRSACSQISSTSPTRLVAVQQVVAAGLRARVAVEDAEVDLDRAHRLALAEGRLPLDRRADVDPRARGKCGRRSSPAGASTHQRTGASCSSSSMPNGTTNTPPVILKPSLNHRGALLAHANGLTSSAADSIRITGLNAGATSAEPGWARGIETNSKAIADVDDVGVDRRADVEVGRAAAEVRQRLAGLSKVPVSGLRIEMSVRCGDREVEAEVAADLDPAAELRRRRQLARVEEARAAAG
jgi:hypothetical protein